MASATAYLLCTQRSSEPAKDAESGSEAHRVRVQTEAES